MGMVGDLEQTATLMRTHWYETIPETAVGTGVARMNGYCVAGRVVSCGVAPRGCRVNGGL